MSRRIRTLLGLVLVSFSLIASACADTTGPQAATCKEWNSSNTCIAWN